MSMLVKRRVVRLDEILEALTAAKSLSDAGGFPSNVCPEVGGVHSVDRAWRGVLPHKLFASWKMQQTIANKL